MADQHSVHIGHDDMLQLVHDVGTVVDVQRQTAAKFAMESPSRIEAKVRPKQVYVSCDGIMYCTNEREPRPVNGPTSGCKAPGVETAERNSRPLSSANNLELAGITGFAARGTSLWSGLKDLTGDSSLNIRTASVSHGTDLKTGLGRATTEIGWRDAFTSSESDTLMDSQDIDSLFASLADNNSDLLDNLMDNAFSKLENRKSF